jgi:hypothetical protein
MTTPSIELKEIASNLVRRGQTIYGRKQIIDICSKSQVSLLDDYSGEFARDDTKEALNKFLILYSKLGQAARLTLLILSKQFNLSLPEEATRKKSSFLRMVEGRL